VIPPPEPELPDPKPSDPAPHDSDPSNSHPESPHAASAPAEASPDDEQGTDSEPALEPEPDPLEPRAPRPSRRSSAAPKARSSAACDKARAGMRAFVAGPTQVGPPPAWRTHMSACTACTFAYHELVQQAARLARGATRVTERTTERYYEERARRSLIATNAGRGSKLPRLFLPVTVIALIVMIVTQSGTKHVELRSLAGVVTRGQSAMNSDETVAVQRGDGCSTGASARAELSIGESHITFGPESSFLVDRLDKLAVRFFAGEARAEGDAILLLPMGAVEVRKGVVVVKLQDGVTLITCESGDVTRSEATGRHIVPPGETQRIEPPVADSGSR
jgi:hypothetical protein